MRAIEVRSLGHVTVHLPSSSPSVRRSLRKTPKGQRGKGQQGRVVEVTAGGARSGAKGRKKKSKIA